MVLENVRQFTNTVTKQHTCTCPADAGAQRDDAADGGMS